MERWYIYILQSEKNGKYYIGYTSNVDERLKTHNQKMVRATKSGAPWKIIHTEEFQNRQEAYRRERQIKRYKSGEAFKKLIDGV